MRVFISQNFSPLICWFQLENVRVHKHRELHITEVFGQGYANQSIPIRQFFHSYLIVEQSNALCELLFTSEFNAGSQKDRFSSLVRKKNSVGHQSRSPSFTNSCSQNP